MMEKIKSEKMTSASKPVPMKLFAAWEVDRTPSNCIPRLCTLRITNLRVCGPLGDAGCPNTGAVILAARMHSSKRTLRSNDIIIPPSDVELDLCFSLQYPHFVKRDGNRLQIMLQRRKKYKNRTILGCKTLAEGVIRMDQVLQRSMDMELELIGVGGKGGCAAGQPVARITITGLASTPVDHDTKNNNTMVITERGYSDEEEEGEFSSVEEAEDMTYGAPARRRAHRQLAFNKGDMSYTKQRNLKQKFAALLRRFRVPEDMGERDATRDHARNTQRDIDELFQELESLSCGEGEDSGPDQMDTISIVSTPKPSLRPFFTSSRCLANQDMHRHSNVACQASLAYYNELPPVKEKVTNVVLSESEVLRSSAGDERGSEGNSDGDVTAEALASGASVSSSPPKDVKEDKRSRLFRSSTSGGNLTPSSAGRKKASLVIATNRPLSAHELPAQSPTSIEPRRSAVEQVLVVVGEEGPLPEVVALSNGHGCGQLAMQALHVPTLICDRDVKPMLTALYARLHTQASRRCDTRIVLCGDSVFCSNVLRAHTELSARHVPDKQCSTFLIVPIGPNVIARHLAASDPVYAALFLTESWNTLSERGTDSTVSEIQQMASRIQRYINSNTPVNLVPIGEAMVAYRELCGEEDVNNSFVPFLSEVRVGLNEGEEEGSPGRVSPPTVSANPHEHEPIELQLDYWLVPKSPTEESKVTIKAAFRSLHVTRQNGNLSITYITKEKKQKIMRLGKKKEKPGEAEVGRTQSVAGVTRLICSAKGSHNAPLKVYIDGTEWNGVKFFKLSRQWQTHVKTFPVATLSEPQVTDN